MKEEAEIYEHGGYENHEKDLWKGIWLLHVPNEVKNFIWRACRNSLPTKMNLVRQTVIAVSICERCRSDPKNILHALWLCPELDVIWSNSELLAIHMTTTFLDFKELLSWILKNHWHLDLFALTV